MSNVITLTQANFDEEVLASDVPATRAIGAQPRAALEQALGLPVSTAQAA